MNSSPESLSSRATDGLADALPAIAEAARAVELALVVADARAVGAPILFANPAAQKRAGDDRGLLGAPLARLVPAADTARVAAAIDAGAVGQAGTVHFAAAGDAPAGALSLVPVVSGDGLPRYLVAAVLTADGPDAAAQEHALDRAVALMSGLAGSIASLMRAAEAAAGADRSGRSATEIARDAVDDAGSPPG